MTYPSLAEAPWEQAEAGLGLGWVHVQGGQWCPQANREDHPLVSVIPTGQGGEKRPPHPSSCTQVVFLLGFLKSDRP